MNDFIYVVCEGQSEASFVKRILSPYFLDISGGKCFLTPYTVITSRNKRAGRIFRGGLGDYIKPKNDIIRCLKNNRYVTTMFDLFRLPTDFPGYDEVQKKEDDLEKTLALEKALFEDINNRLFIPYIELHEFEALFYSDLDALKTLYLGCENEIDALKQEVAGKAPEDVNGGDETSPSKRLLKHFRYEKGNEVMIPLEKIGVEKMMEACPHFGDWVERLKRVVISE